MSKVVAKAISNKQGYVLEKIGTEVVYPEHNMAMRLAKLIVANNVLDYLTLSNEVEITEIKIHEHLVGTSVDEADIRKLYGLNIIAIKHDGDIITGIRPEYIFEKMIL